MKTNMILSAVAPFDLALVAPTGMLKQKVTVYVSSGPLYAN
jgi:hypothetical protein